eukprot:2626499-Rhodomonas_salina.2
MSEPDVIWQWRARRNQVHKPAMSVLGCSFWDWLQPASVAPRLAARGFLLRILAQPGSSTAHVRTGHRVASA